MIEIQNVSKYYGKFLAVHIDSLEIREDCIFGLVGINGSGKSTLLRVLAGVYKAEEGEVTFDKEAIYENEELKKKIIYISDDPFYNSVTTVESIYQIYHSFYHMERSSFEMYLKMFDLPMKGSLSRFSKGMRRRVYLAVALAVSPKYLLLDEVFDGIDPKGKALFKKALLEKMEKSEMTVVIASHALRELENLCDSYAMLEKGKMIATGLTDGASQMIHKYIVGFNAEIDGLIFNDESILSVSGKGKVFTIVAKGDSNVIEAYLKSLSPILCEEQEMTFEEVFMYTGEVNHE